jgi:hypothetical protein
MKRAISFERAKARFQHRYTIEHVPAWARQRAGNGKYYAPQYASDREWYEKTRFYGEDEMASKGRCYSSDESWPLGTWLDQPLKG